MSIDADAKASGTSPRPYSVLAVERDGHVATLFLDRPEKRNAMGSALWNELPQAMGELSRDRSVRAVVIAARGPHFTVGLDLFDLAGIAGDAGGEGPGAGGEGSGSGSGARSAAEQASRTYAEVLRLQGAITAVAECAKPVIAAVHGYCIGGGVDLITACDIRVAAAGTVFSIRETRMAMVADLGTLQRLPYVIPGGHVAELAYTGRDFGAERAEQIGLVNHVFPDPEAALAGARAIAGEIAANPPLAVQGTKAVLAEAVRRQVDEGLRFVAAWNAGQLRSHDLTEAVTAFMEKRKPTFEGR